MVSTARQRTLDTPPAPRELSASPGPRPWVHLLAPTPPPPSDELAHALGALPVTPGHTLALDAVRSLPSLRWHAIYELAATGAVRFRQSFALSYELGRARVVALEPLRTRLLGARASGGHAGPSAAVMQSLDEVAWPHARGVLAGLLDGGQGAALEELSLFEASAGHRGAERGSRRRALYDDCAASVRLTPLLLVGERCVEAGAGLRLRAEGRELSLALRANASGTFELPNCGRCGGPAQPLALAPHGQDVWCGRCFAQASGALAPGERPCPRCGVLAPAQQEHRCPLA